MYIDNVLIMNLQRREDKWLYQLGTLRALDFPMFGDNSPWGDTIIRHIAHDGLDYPTTEAVYRAAVADGFPHFDNFRMKTRGIVAWLWTWASALRRVAEMDKTVMLLIDDFMPQFGWSWSRFQALIRECKGESENHGEFRAIQMRHNLWGQDRRPEYKPHTSMLAKGFHGCSDQSTILTSKGAQLLLDIQATPPFGFPDGDFRKIAQMGVDDSKYYSGLWHTLDMVFAPNYYPWESDLQT